VAWFFRVVEIGEGRWACRWGEKEYDTHADMRRAIEHVTVLAAAHRPAEVVLHRLDGSVEHLGAV
jgi:hypothetical protein